MRAKEVFMGIKDVPQWWQSVANDQKFQLVMVTARAEYFAYHPTQEQITGVDHFIALLEKLAQNEETNAPFPSPMLHHQIDKLPERPKTSS